MRVSRTFAAAVVTALIAFGPGQAAYAQDVVVFAAASLTNALDEAAKLFERQGRRTRQNILRGESGAGQADRTGGARGYLHVRRYRLDGLRGG